MASLRPAGAILICAAVVGCSSELSGFATAPPDHLAMSAEGGGAQVTGHAMVLLPPFDNVESYSSNAVLHANGSVSGEFELVTNQGDGFRLHGSVACVSLIGNIARLEGIVDQSTIPFVAVGSHMRWTVVDNGEGSKAPPDQTSSFRQTLNPADYGWHCAIGLDVLGLLDIVSGNIQVH